MSAFGNLMSRFTQSENQLEQLDEQSVQELESMENELQEKISDHKEEIGDEQQELDDVKGLIEDHKDVHRRLEAFRSSKQNLGENPGDMELGRLTADWWNKHGEAINEDLEDIKRRADEMRNLEEDDLALRDEVKGLESAIRNQLNEIGQFVHGEVEDVEKMRDSTEQIRKQFGEAADVASQV